MKTYTAKTVEDALIDACKELNEEPDKLSYEIKEEKKGLFSKTKTKKVVINVYQLSDVVEFVEKYLNDIVSQLELGKYNISTTLEDDVIRTNIDTEHNPILIGRAGKTLQALNIITRLAVLNKFKRRYRVLLDVGEYKNMKYHRVANIARRVARDVQKTKFDTALDPMPADERRIVHNTLAKFSHIRTESEGVGKDRAVVIRYVDEE